VPRRLRGPLVLRCVDDYLAGARYPVNLISHLMNRPVEALSAAAGG
jgi:hypothetical protein